jgi:hypothetical protein
MACMRTDCDTLLLTVLHAMSFRNSDQQQQQQAAEVGVVGVHLKALVVPVS